MARLHSTAQDNVKLPCTTWSL